MAIALLLLLIGIAVGYCRIGKGSKLAGLLRRALVAAIGVSLILAVWLIGLGWRLRVTAG